MFNSYAQDWVGAEINVPSVELNDLRFTNRARCALDSKKPTDSVFLLVQNMEVAKGIYRLAKNTGNSSSELTKMGIQVYRYAVINLIKHIHEKLMNGELPLLAIDTTGKNVPKAYASISARCKSDSYCNDLDVYMSHIWNVSRTAGDSSKKQKLYQALDNFNGSSFISKSGNGNLNCFYLKKFSPLQAPLYGSIPTASVFEQLAKTNISSGEYLGDCFNIDDQKDLKVASYQLEIPDFNSKNWDQVGFDYWNSLKLYFSWAWRNAPEFEKMGSPFTEILRGVAVEESVMIIPNGCKSITPAKCDGEYVQLNAIRQFARESFKKEAIKTDVLAPIPNGPQDEMLGDDTRFPAVNRDILDMAHYETAEAWMENFRDNLSKTRGIMKRKLLKSINFLNLVTTKLSVEKIQADVNKKFERIGLKSNGEFIASTTLTDQEKFDLKNDLYYLCGEFIQGSHDELSFIKGDLEILRKTTLIDNIASQISVAKTSEFFKYYETLAASILNKCNSLEQKQFWDDNFVLDKSGFSQWYIDKIYEGKVESKAKEKLAKYLVSNQPMLAFKSYNTTKDQNEVLCIDGPHCARNTLDSIINLYAVAQYANTFWSMDQMIKTPAAFNPYAERTACKVYDPWFKTKQLLFNLFVNLGQAAMSPFIPGAGVFASLDLQPGRVVSFKQLIEEGKIQYDVKRERASIFRGLVADLGPLIGVPCRVSITRDFENPYDYLSFAGITVGGCYNRNEGNLDVYSASDFGDPNISRVNACASCTINFGTVSSSLTAIGNFVPYVGAGLFLFDGMVRLYNSLKDPDNIPRTWQANPTYVLDTYRRFGNIPKRCVKELARDQQCLGDWTEEKILSDLREDLKVVNIKSINRKTASSNAEVMIHGCAKPLKVKLYPIRKNQLEIPSECAALKKGLNDKMDEESDQI